jgi:ATP-dependent protease ClpP protease subunit
MKASESFIQVESLDNTETSQIVNAIDKLENESSSKQELKIKLHSLKGTLEHSLEIATAAHGASKVDLSIDVYGANGPAAAIVCAAGKPGSRVASMGTTFILNDKGAYEDGTKAADLEGEDKIVYQTLSALTGKRKYILDSIVKGVTIDVRGAKKIGIVDSIKEFKSKYILPKTKKAESSGYIPAQRPESAQQVPVTEIPKGRGRRKSTSNQ